MKRIGALWLGGAFLFAALVGVAVPALGLDLDQAKASGLVGERPDGYVGIVPANPPAEVRELVDAINAKRKAVYAEIAQKQGTPVAAVAALAGQRQIEKAPSGHYVADASGAWSRKP